jgi:hypothetical protein
MLLPYHDEGVTCNQSWPKLTHPQEDGPVPRHLFGRSDVIICTSTTRRLTIPAHTPMGGWVEYIVFSSSSCSISSSIPIVAKARNHTKAAFNSTWESESGLPCSRVNSFAIFSQFSSMRSAYLRSSLARSEKGVVLQDLKARLAPCTAASRSSFRATGTS